MRRLKSRFFHLLCTLALVCAVLLEFYPKGLESIRISYPGEALSDYFSYFSPALLKSENPFPLITGILTLLLLLFSILKLFKKIKRKCWKAVMLLTRTGALFSSYVSFLDMPTQVSFMIPSFLLLSGIFPYIEKILKIKRL